MKKRFYSQFNLINVPFVAINVKAEKFCPLCDHPRGGGQFACGRMLNIIRWLLTIKETVPLMTCELIGTILMWIARAWVLVAMAPTDGGKEIGDFAKGSKSALG